MSDAQTPTALETALRARIGAGGRVFVPYVTGGLFGVDADLLRALEETGADAVEVGVPFSDPVMDGGVIQEASRRALESGFHPRDAFDLVEEAALGVPVVLMTYLNPVLAMGIDAAVEGARAAGVAGFIVPDLPADEGEEWVAACREAGIATVFLAAPGEDARRLQLIVRTASGFVYCVSTYGVTGARDELGGSSRDVVETLRSETSLPLLAGVGISTPEQAAEACAFADGVIVGSALVKPMLAGDLESALDAARAFRHAVA